MASSSYSWQPLKTAFDDQLGTRIGSMRMLLCLKAEDPDGKAPDEVDGSVEESPDEPSQLKMQSIGRGVKDSDRDQAVLRSRRRFAQDLADFTERLANLAQQFGEMLQAQEEFGPN